MGTIIANIATFAFVPVVIAYFGVLFSTQRRGTHREMQRLVTILALPIFTTLNTLAVVTRPQTVSTRVFSLLWLGFAVVGGCRIALGSRRRSATGVERQYAVAACMLCLAVIVRNVVYLLT